jgi:SAM-dependent methyltransferase
LRLKAVKKTLQRLHLIIADGWQVLDVGCGSGDFIEEFAAIGAHVTGADISESLVDWTTRRFSSRNNVKVRVGKAEHLNMADNSFDLVVSVNVLQHIVDSVNFESAVRNMLRVAKHGRYILVFETSPGKNCKVQPLSYLCVRVRNEWIRLFEMRECRLIYEMPFPELGIRFVETFDALLSKLLDKRGKHHAADGFAESSIRSKGDRMSIIDAARITVLRLLYPLDNFFASLPFPREASVMRILVFRKI